MRRRALIFSGTTATVFPTSLILHMRLPPLRRIAVLWAVVLVASCRNPQADAAIAEQMRDMGDELNNARLESSAMSDRIDSLRTVVARQDTLLRQLAGMAGVPVPSR